MTTAERDQAVAWMEENAVFFPAFAPQNLNVPNLIDHWSVRFNQPEARDDPKHWIWDLARDIASRAVPIQPWTPEEESENKEMARLESKILHGTNSEEELARYQQWRTREED